MIVFFLTENGIDQKKSKKPNADEVRCDETLVFEKTSSSEYTVVAEVNLVFNAIFIEFVLPYTSGKNIS